jgi:hypothetical protein
LFGDTEMISPAGGYLARCISRTGKAMLKLRSIGLSDYSVLEGRQRIGRIHLATERIVHHLETFSRLAPRRTAFNSFDYRGSVSSGIPAFTRPSVDPIQDM